MCGFFYLSDVKGVKLFTKRQAGTTESKQTSKCLVNKPLKGSFELSCKV